MNSSDRIRWIDIAKGVAILSVILGHTFMFGNPVHAFVYSFHIPLFFIVSGYLAKPKKVDIKKLSKRLLCPYFAICFSTTCLSLISQSISGSWVRRMLGAVIWASGGDIDELGIPGIGLAWFLMAMYVARLFHSYTLSFFEKRGIAEHYRFLYFFGALMLGWGLSKLIVLPFSLEQGLIASFYIYMGSLVRKLDEHVGPALRMCLCLLALGIWIISLQMGCFYSIGNLFHVRSLAMGILMSLSSSYFVLQLCELVDDFFSASVALDYLARVGECSLTVLCIHWIEASFIQWGVMSANANLSMSLAIGLQHIALVLGIYLVIACSFPAASVVYSQSSSKRSDS